MNREGKTYSNAVLEVVIVVVKSTAWNPERPDTSNYSHEVAVLSSGATVRIDEVPAIKSWNDDGWREI